MSRYYNDFYTVEDPDYIEHYGVKGMKWRQHLKRKTNAISDDLKKSARRDRINALRKNKQAGKHAVGSKIEGYDLYTYKKGVGTVKQEYAPTKEDNKKKKKLAKQAKRSLRKARVKEKLSKIFGG